MVNERGDVSVWMLNEDTSYVERLLRALTAKGNVNISEEQMLLMVNSNGCYCVINDCLMRCRYPAQGL